MLFTKRTKGAYQYFFLAVMLSLFSLPAMAGWQLEWIDDFDGTRVNKNNWTSQIQANYNNEVQCYTDDDTSAIKNYDVSNGTLKIIARKRANNCVGLNGALKSWTSGRLNSKDKREFLYGRIESRIRFNTLKAGTWPAFWMLENRIKEHPIANDNDTIGWPNPGAGEIDVWEWYANEGNSYITNFFNSSNCGSKVLYNYPNGATDVLQWHTYAMEWDANTIQFFMDDSLVATQNIASCAQYKEPMFALLNVAIGGDLGGAIDSTLDTATMEVDYIAHCSKTTSNSRTICNPNSTVTETVVADDLSIFNTTESSSWAAWDCCSGTNPTVVMDDAAHAEVMEFNINGNTVVGFISRSPSAANSAPFNASSFMANGTVEFDLKMTAAPTAGGDPAWKLKIESGGGPNHAEVNLSSSVEGHALPVLNTWQHYSFKLSDLAAAGLNIGSIDLLMVFPSWGMGDGAVFRIDNVEIVSNAPQTGTSTAPATPATSGTSSGSGGGGGGGHTGFLLLMLLSGLLITRPIRSKHR
ncbi:MAG: family 16 glycosylhydrolase [Leucothrix sp.]